MKYIVLLSTLAHTPEYIKQTLGSVPEQAYDWRSDKQAWSIQMVIAHLCHAEPLFRARFKHIVTEANPLIKAFDPDEASPVSGQSTLQLLQAFRAERLKTLTALYELAPDAWSRVARHQTQGATTLEQQVQNLVNHDTNHTGQIIYLSQAWQKYVTRFEDTDTPE